VDGVEQKNREERADDGAGVVERALKSERSAAALDGRDVGDHGVARRRSNPFSGPIEKARAEDAGPPARQRDPRPRHGRQRVAADDQPFASRQSIGNRSRHEFENRRECVRRSFDQSDDHRRRAQRGCEKDRQKRIDHLAR